MAKQLTVIFVATVLFSFTWVLVILQLVKLDDKAETSIEQTNELQEDRVSEVIKIIEDERKQDHHQQLSNFNTENTAGNAKRVVVDLREYDFSNVESKDGVPIDAILKKLEIR